MSTTQRDIDSSSQVLAAIERQPGEGAGRSAFGGQGRSLNPSARPAIAVSEPPVVAEPRTLSGSSMRGRASVRDVFYWQSNPHAFDGPSGDAIFAYSLCGRCRLPSIHRIHTRDNSKLETRNSELSISDRLLTCAACEQLVKADDFGWLEFHEAPLTHTVQHKHHLGACKGSYTKGYPARPLPEAATPRVCFICGPHCQCSQPVRGYAKATEVAIRNAVESEPNFSFIETIDAPAATKPKTSRTLLPVQAQLLTSRTAAETNYRAVSDVLRDAAAWLEDNHVDDADFECLQLTRKFLPQATDENDFFFEAIIFHRSPVGA